MGCSGEEGFEIDTTPPLKANLIHHLGDTGDVVGDSICNYIDPNNTEREMNGIDAVPEGNKIQIQWEPIQDSDIDYIRIMRFTQEDWDENTNTIDFIVCVDSIEVPNNPFYLDDNPPIEKNLFYFIDLVDFAGNSTVSDTVCYKLVDKPLLSSTQVYPDSILFEWTNEAAEIISRRILLFDSNHDLIWSLDPNDPNPEDPDAMPIKYTGDTLEPGSNYSWRVDVFGSDVFTEPIQGTSYLVKTGAESEYQYFTR